MTKITLDGSPGDRIGIRDYFFTPRDGIVQAGALDHIIGVTFRNATQSWDLRFEAPAGQSLTNGYYTNALRGVTAEFPSLEVVGNGRGCNAIVGGFNIYRFEQPGDGSLSKLHVTFSQYCDGSLTPLRGEVLLNIPVEPLVLTNQLSDRSSNGSFSIEVVGTSNVMTWLQYSTNLNNTNWITITNSIPATGRFTYTTNSTSSRIRFYRAFY